MADTHSSSETPLVSVVVPALNCAGDVDGFAASMRAQTYPTDRFEVIVVDNGSSDGTLECARAAGFKTLLRPERGRTRALNTGIAAARGDYILTTDLSCRAEPDWISSIVATFSKHPRAGCVGGEIRLLRTASNAVIDFQERSNYMSPLLALQRARLPFMPFADGANSSFRREMFERIGGFEESFVKAGDVEICYRMLVLSDYELVFNRAALMREPGEPSLRALLRQRFRMGIGWNLMRMKYPALYAIDAPGSFEARRAWWAAREALGRSSRLLALNAGMLLGQSPEAVIDADIRQLMSWAQWYGREYGRRWLKREGISPEPIERERLAAFIARPTPLAGRIHVIDSQTGA